MAYGDKYYSSKTTTLSPVESNEKIIVYLKLRGNNYTKDYDKWDRDDKSTMYLNFNEFDTVYIKNYRGSGYRIRVQFIRLWGVTNNDLYKLNLLYHIDGKDKLVTNGDLDYWDIKNNQLTPDYTLYDSGEFTIWASVKFYEPKTGKTYNESFKVVIMDSSMHSNVTAPITVHEPELFNVTKVGDFQTSFYKNEPFTVGNVQIYSHYRHVVDGTNVSPILTTNYTTTISQGTKLTTAEKNKKITLSVSYNGTTKSLEYAINVYGVASYSKPIFPTYIKQGQNVDGLLADTVFTYEDGTTSDFTTALRTALDTSVPGFVNITYQAYATKTKEYFYWDELNYEEIKS